MNSRTATKYINLARELALPINRANNHVSLVFHNDVVVAVGDNRRKTSPWNRKYQYRLDDVHSEVSALHKCRHLLRKKAKLTLVNFHFNRFGHVKLAKPCQCCGKWVGQIFSRVFYSTPNGIEEYT